MLETHKNTQKNTDKTCYMARSSLAYVRGGVFLIFLSADLYRLCKLGIF